MINRLKAALEADGILTFSVKVRPQAQKTAFRRPLSDETLKIDLAAVPEEGAANEELVRFLAGEFGIAKSEVQILSGQTSRIKTVRLHRD